MSRTKTISFQMKHNGEFCRLDVTQNEQGIGFVQTKIQPSEFEQWLNQARFKEGGIKGMDVALSERDDAPNDSVFFDLDFSKNVKVDFGYSDKIKHYVVWLEYPPSTTRVVVYTTTRKFQAEQVTYSLEHAFQEEKMKTITNNVANVTLDM